MRCPRPSLLLAGLLSLASASAQRQDTTWSARVVTTVKHSDTPTWRKWKNTECAMNYPGPWAVDVSRITGPDVVFLAPLDSARTYREHVDLRVEAGSVADAVERLPKDGALLSDRTEDGVRTVEFNTSMERQLLHCRAQVRLHDGKAYVIGYYAPIATFEESLFLAEAMMNSFTFLK